MEDKQARASTTATPTNAAELLVRCLENEGVKYVFGVPGEEILDLLDALSRSTQIQFVTTRHEQGAAFMADVYGRLSTYPGVCLATLGPGATNLITGIADATLDRAPLVAITGQAGLERVHKESHQYIDVVQMLQPDHQVERQGGARRSVPEMVRKAFRLARLEKPGATHLELPEDVAAMPVPPGRSPDARAPHDLSRRQAVTLAKAADLLCRGAAPARAGGQRRDPPAGQRARGRRRAGRLCPCAEHPGAPTFMGKGCIDYRDPHSLGTRRPAAARRGPGGDAPAGGGRPGTHRRLRPGGVVARAVEPAPRQRDHAHRQHARRDRRPLPARARGCGRDRRMPCTALAALCQARAALVVACRREGRRRRSRA